MDKTITLQQRAEFYNEAFPKYPPLVVADKWIYGMWMLGQNYKGSGYYGAFPPNYIKRIMSMFPDAKNILHLFSGSLDDTVQGDRFDINPDLEPDICGDAHELNKFVNKQYDLILADPPYSEEDALHYGTCMIKRNIVFKECTKVLEKGGILIWLDQVCPQWRKNELEMFLTIGVIRSSQHRFRVVTGFVRI